MKQTIRKKFIAFFFIVLLADIALGYLFWNSRALSHLAAWNIVESTNRQDFYWTPDNSPGYFRLESDAQGLLPFKQDTRSIIEEERDDFKTVLTLSRDVRGLGSGGKSQDVRVRWDSPQGILHQMQEGALGHCFQRSVVLSSYVSSLGIPSRLWALENEMLDATAHTVSEVYIPSIEKWVFLDAFLGFYATRDGDGLPLSFLEFRERLLDPAIGSFVLHDLNGEIVEQEAPAFYKKLVTCAFLRGRNDFTTQHRARYGPLFAFRQYLDKLPNSVRIGLDYFLTSADIFVHYEDRFSPSLRAKARYAKMLFYLFVSLSVALGGVLIFLLGEGFLRHRSRKETRHK
ncbi:MAG: hypothetical protein JW847_03200 [Candidatus Omnitrophica bacterium]|nr:hypothetical protein [Candidatus Omnitrophota bacterium]